MLWWLVAAFLGGWGVAAAYREAGPIVSEWVQVREVVVTGIDQITRQEVLDRLGLRPDDTLFSVSPTRMEERLTLHPWIKQVTVSRVPFHTLAVRIDERRAEAVLRDHSMTLLLDGEGAVLSVLQEDDKPPLPVLVGVDPRELMRGDSEPRQLARAGIRLASWLRGEFGGLAEVIVADPENVVGSVNGRRFRFGASPFEEKWDRYRKVEQALRASADAGWGGPITPCQERPASESSPALADATGTRQGTSGDGCPEIDLRFPGKVIVRERG